MFHIDIHVDPVEEPEFMGTLIDFDEVESGNT
jgi:hypothetical protein